jgi:heat shock protein HslJ
MAQIPQSPFVNTTWGLEQLDGVRRLPQTRRQVHLIFADNDSTLRGFAGCNNFNGSYQININSDQLRLSRFMATKMSCPNLTFEYDFLGVLEKTTRYEIKGRQLFLYQERKLIATFQAIEL